MIVPEIIIVRMKFPKKSFKPVLNWLTGQVRPSLTYRHWSETWRAGRYTLSPPKEFPGIYPGEKSAHFINWARLGGNPVNNIYNRTERIITSAEREVNDSRSSGMFQSCIRMSRSCFRMSQSRFGISSKYLQVL